MTHIGPVTIHGPQDDVFLIHVEHGHPMPPRLTRWEAEAVVDELQRRLALRGDA